MTGYAKTDTIPDWLAAHLPPEFDRHHEVVQRAHLHSLLEIPMDADWRSRAAVVYAEIDDLVHDSRRGDRESLAAAYWRHVHARVAARTAALLRVERRPERCRTCPEVPTERNES